MTNLNSNVPRNYTVSVEEEILASLKNRLADTRWPDKETVDDWSQGMPLASLQQIARYWREEYDWRRCERQINALGSSMIEIDGLDIHFLHVRSESPSARPMILTHGWPGSIVEFFELIPLLTDPLAHGGDESEAFHVVVPSLPGFGFSGKPSTIGWDIDRIADAWNELMVALDYQQYLAQGGDWGSVVTTYLACRHPERCKAVHINFLVASPGREVIEAPTPEESASLTKAIAYRKQGSGYWMQQTTRPQTLGYGITDSPVGQAAWILEKFFEWTDNDGTLESMGGLDRLLDNVMMYWLTSSATSSARLYWEGGRGRKLKTVSAPVGCTVFPKEIHTPSRRWAESRYQNIFYWNEVPEGGHFAAFEKPRILQDEIVSCFRDIQLTS